MSHFTIALRRNFTKLFSRKTFFSFYNDYSLIRRNLSQVVNRSVTLLPNRVAPIYKDCTIPESIGRKVNCKHLQWSSPIKNVLIIKKPFDQQVSSAFAELVNFIHMAYPEISVIVEPNVAQEYPHLHLFTWNDIKELHAKADAIITLGGDGTILHTASLYAQTNIPPVLSFSMGTLGFLLPFSFSSFQKAFSQFYDSKSYVLRRMRLCLRSSSRNIKSPYYAMNELHVHRGLSPHMSVLEVYVNDEFLTEAISDGLIVATPTGSTAYSLSAGGPIVHPSINSLLLTPICPNSLSFRPALFPESFSITIKMSRKSRTRPQLSVDGKPLALLEVGQCIEVTHEKNTGIPCVIRNYDGDDWVNDINNLLRWNHPFHRKQ
ncbi:NADH kinase [Schizosaccharomyces japonicus yFS275]|uniref:NADH kinase n=1 Tax=Schizosaccharomyces japonicus (strain yFS275 / FY16936) TaxID=402676 RepID=B6K5H1_SCHJY|nr:NADH kinase [Schizosaccharomyces japonicus yFS275]EEB08775.1 NADH kinase [Schizosaccharomyces japonicus yFS275]